MPTYPSVYRAKAVKYEAPVLTAFVPQVYGDVALEITEFIGGPTQGMGWVFFQGGNSEFPVWQGEVATVTAAVGGGGTVTDTLWVGADAPTDEGIELWWDEDADPPLAAKGGTANVTFDSAGTGLVTHGMGRTPTGWVGMSHATATYICSSPTGVAATATTIPFCLFRRDTGAFLVSTTATIRWMAF